MNLRLRRRQAALRGTQVIRGASVGGAIPRHRTVEDFQPRARQLTPSASLEARHVGVLFSCRRRSSCVFASQRSASGRRCVAGGPGDEAVLSRDNLKIAFRVHTVWRVDASNVPLFMERYSTTLSDSRTEKEPDAIVKVAYGHFIREPLRTFARDEVQRRNGLEVKDAFIPIGEAVLSRIRAYATASPFIISSVVVGNVQYPAEVSDAVSRKLAATQELQRKDTEIEIERKERTKREVQAQGIANAMQIIRGQLSAMYIQHEAIEAQKAMVNSPNHTVVYIPVGPMGVPITGTFPTVPASTTAER